MQHPLEVAAVADQRPAQAFGTRGADPAFGVGFRRPRRGLERLYAGRGEHRVERRGELAVAIPDGQPEPVGALVEIHQQIPGGLGHPRAGRMRSDPGQVQRMLIVATVPARR